MIPLAEQISSLLNVNAAAGLASQVASALLFDGYEIGGIKVDSVVDESHESTVTATSYPIEFGANVSDHIYANADSITVSGLISDIESSAFAAVGAVGLAAKIKSNLTGSADVSRSSQAWTKLKELQRSGQLFTIKTNLQDYDNMAIISMSCRQDKDNADCVRFTMNLRELFIVGTEKYTGNIQTLIGTTASKPAVKAETKTGADNSKASDAVADKTKIGNMASSPQSLFKSSVESITKLFKS